MFNRHLCTYSCIRSYIWNICQWMWKIGVWCFLVISGFLAMQSMEHTNKKEFLNDRKSWIVSFYKKKIVRLYPLYTVSLLLGFCIGFLPDFSDLGKHLFCLEGTGHFWYMPVIIKFNLILPIGYFLYITISEKWFLIINIILALICEIAFPFCSYIENSIQLRWYFPVFVIGMIIYWTYRKLANQKTKYPLLFTVIAITDILIMLLFTPIMRQILWGIAPSSWLQNKYILYAVLWGVLIISLSKCNITEHHRKIQQFLEWISKYSYELYLFHYLFLFWFNRHLDNILINGFVVLLFSFLLSIIMNHLQKIIVAFFRKYQDS